MFDRLAHPMLLSFYHEVTKDARTVSLFVFCTTPVAVELHHLRCFWQVFSPANGCIQARASLDTAIYRGI